MADDLRIGDAAIIEIDPPLDQDSQIIPNASLSVSLKRPDNTTDGPFDLTYDAFLDKYTYSYLTTLSGEYRWRVSSGTGSGVVEGAFYVYPQFSVDTDAWQPTLTDVASLVPTRTIDDDGIQQNTFTSSTTPTATQVTNYITQIVAEISGVVGDIPSANFTQAKHTANLGVAWLVERSFPPTADVQNLGTDFVNDYRASLRALTTTVRAQGKHTQSAFTIAPGRATSTHQPWCSLSFGAAYCSCGADIAGYPLYEYADGDAY